MTKTAAILGWAVHIPGHDGTCDAAHAETLLGRRGMLGKEPATRLALCAVHTALGLAPGERRTGAADPRTAVVVASNLGNVATVAAIAQTIASEGVRGVSALDAPNASSNIIASAIAIWFRFGGPNLMVCSGAGAGLDAAALAMLALTARRCERAVVVGVEPDDEVARVWHGGVSPLRASAACIILGPAGTSDLELTTDDESSAPLHAPALSCSEAYGAFGVLQLASAAAALAAPNTTGSALRVEGHDAGGPCSYLIGRHDARH